RAIGCQTQDGTADWRSSDAWPDVDVVMPIRNEAPHLETALASVRMQAYPGRVRIILGVGPSDDGTEALAASLASSADDLLVVENPSGRTPSALNVAIRAGTAPVVVRVDGHSQLSAGYVRRAVEIMRETGAANVGGVQRPEPTTPFEQSVADATTSILGTGGASYRIGSVAGSVDTVYLGVFDRAAIEAVGLFDESLIRNQDYELNIRLRDAGDTVWFDPSLSVGYTPRSTWKALARQYFEYGWWKAVVLRKHPHSLRLRQLIPPVGVIGVVLGSVAGLRWRPMLIVPFAYASAVSLSGRMSRRPFRTALALATIHSSWTTGLLLGLSRPGRTGQSIDARVRSDRHRSSPN
ncbi:glycosyltransferase family 2 protein, partial [Ilumatobacter nonamiensis]|uniref:glycosyltransferase family 2 protein n=1 Tax=Ilumatobacter nonamiensis TaxID=467093 RepID=UPI000686B9F5